MCGLAIYYDLRAFDPNFAKSALVTYHNFRLSVAMDENIIKTKPAADAGAACVENNSVSREKATDSSSIIQSTSEEVLIDGGYGWVCVVAVAFINACTWGISTVSILKDRQRSERRKY